MLKVGDVLAARLRIEATGAIRVTTPDLRYRLAAELGWPACPKTTTIVLMLTIAPHPRSAIR